MDIEIILAILAVCAIIITSVVMIVGIYLLVVLHNLRWAMGRMRLAITEFGLGYAGSLFRKIFKK